MTSPVKQLEALIDSGAYGRFDGQDEISNWFRYESQDLLAYIRKLEEALRFYADAELHRDWDKRPDGGIGEYIGTTVHADRGERARAALREEE